MQIAAQDTHNWRCMYLIISSHSNQSHIEIGFLGDLEQKAHVSFGKKKTIMQRNKQYTTESKLAQKRCHNFQITCRVQSRCTSRSSISYCCHSFSKTVSMSFCITSKFCLQIRAFITSEKLLRKATLNSIHNVDQFMSQFIFTITEVFCLYFFRF